MPIDAVWRQAVKNLNGCLHNDDKIWRMAFAKIEGALPKEIKMIKNNPLKSIELNWDPKPVINFLDPKQFYEHYQELCDLIYNPPPRIIYTIPEEELISSCASELESTFNPNSNSDNDNNKNNSSSSKQKLRWFSNNNESIMLKCTHNTNTEFDLRYPGKNPIKLESHLHICIDLKIIAQAIFLPLVKVAQLVSVRNREELGITAKEIQRFGSTSRIDIPINITKEEICRYHITNNLWIKGMLSAPTRTIKTDEFKKFRPTTTYTAQNVTQ
ncbi:hypothetical protein G9A89_023080 [Geosiphon pyriformis]|nr:hypothetical protein G9A89_023080 [Geosiphon pyriformis]